MPEPIQQEAAQNLIARAMQAERQSEAHLLIDAAQRIDPTIQTGPLKNAWLMNWLQANKNRNGELSQ